MRTPIVCVALLLLTSFFSHAQISEHFHSPPVPWQGTADAWQVRDGRLQSNYLQPNSRFWLWAPAGIGLPATWEWWMQVDFNTSSNNYVDVYLLSDSSHLFNDPNTGYFLRIGGKDDKVCLYKKTPGNAPEKIIDGRNGITNQRSATLKLKVSCDDEFNWRVWTDTSGTGQQYVLEGAATGSAVRMPLCYGIVIYQSTASFFQRHFFDDVQVQPLVKDTLVYHPPGRYAIIIQEILPDPDPPVRQQLPEFAELRNNSRYPVQLKNWRLHTTAGEVLLPSLLLEPDSLLLLCRQDKAGMFADSMRVLGLERFPALGNEADTLTLYDAEGRVMHAVAYDKSWYKSSAKEKGGWSLEMIPGAATCDGNSGWQCSAAINGSTPGRPNSGPAGVPSNTPPALLLAEVLDSTMATLHFSKTLDSLTAADPAVYQIHPGTSRIAAAIPLAPLFNTVLLRLSNPLEKEQVYTLEVKGLTGCDGQPIDERNSVTLAMPAVPDSGQVLFSEVLFNPAPMAPEFVEILNQGSRVADLQQLYIGMLDEDGLAGNKVPLSKAQRLLLPGQYMALTRDPDALCRYYTCKAWENLQEVSNLPAFPNEGGTLALYDAAGKILDRMHYAPDMQWPLATNTKGVSLERLSFREPALDARNWHAAAITAGSATPGSVNSQRLDLPELTGAVTVLPAVFSPDNDGMDDVAVIACRLPQAGFAGNISVFDAQGRLVRQLLQNGLLGNHSNIVWDGLGENKQVLSAGIYIIFTEIFDLQGKTKRWKLPVVVARKLN